MKLYQGIKRRSITRHFILRRNIKMIAHPRVAEIFHQNKAARAVFGVDFWRMQAVFSQPVTNMEEWPRVFFRWRRIHQHDCPAPTGPANPEIAAKRSITRQGLNHTIAPPCASKECIDAVRQIRRHGQRSSQSRPGSTMAIRPSPPCSSVIERQPASFENPPA